MLRSTLRKLSRALTSTTRRPARPMTRRTALQVEGLEDRLVMATNLPIGLFQPQPLHVIQGVEGSALGGKSQAAVAFFNSADPSAADFTATIKWGDGTTTQGTVVLEPTRIIPLGRGALQGGIQSNLAGGSGLGGGTVSLPGGFEVLGTHTYKHFGDFTISTTVTSRTGGQQLFVSKAHIQDAPLLPLAIAPFQAVEGVAMPQTQVAAFTDTNPFGVLTDHSAVINWGDGTTSAGVVKAVNGVGPLAKQTDHLIVVGSHTYAEAGPFTVTVTIQDTTNPAFGQPLVVQDPLNVKDQPLTAVAVPAFSLVEGSILPLGKVAGSFKDGNRLAQASDFTAQVNFGDGTTGTGIVVADSAHPGVFNVLTPIITHAYASGTYHLKVTVTDKGGSQVVTDTLVKVADAPLILQSATPVNAFTHLPLTDVPLGTFVDGSITSAVHKTDETVSITWGDGATSTGHVVDNGNGTYSVVGSHTYNKVSGQKPFTIHVVVKDPGGQSLTFNTQATVKDSTTLLPGFVTSELNSLQASIDQQIFGKALPLVGTALSKLGDGSAQDANPVDRIVASFKQALIDGAQAAIGGDLQAVQDAIVKDLGQGVGSVLQGVTTTSGNNGDFTAEVHLHESAALNSGKVDLDLGLAGLPFHFAVNNLAVDVQAGYDIVLDFGMHNGSPFLQTKADPKNTANPLGVALDVHAQLAPGSSVSATLGGLAFTLTQPTSTNPLPVLTTAARVAFPGGLGGLGGLNNAPPSTFDGALKFGFSVDTNGGIQFATPQLSGSADINLQASLTLGDRPRFVILGQPGLLPSVTAGLNVTWSFDSADPTKGGLLGNAPTVAFNDVTIDLGSFLSNVVGPVVTSVQKFTKPLEPVAEVLTAPLPGIKDVTDLLGIDPITVASLIGGSAAPSLTTFANAIEFINGLQIPSTGSINVDVGSFNIADARQANSPATNFVESAAVQQKGLLGAAGGNSTYSSLQTKADFDFPMLDNPVGFVSSVLLGQPVDLVKANLGVELSAGVNVNIPFGIPDVASVNVNFFGSLSLDAGATFVLNDAFLTGGSLLDSLQVQNAHLDVGLTVGVGAGASLLGFSATLDGTVGVTVDLGLTNAATGSTTFTGSDLVNGNVALGFTAAQLQVGLHFEVDAPFGITLYSVDDPLATVNLIPGVSASGGGGSTGGSTGGGSTGGGLGGGTGHKLN